MPYCYKCGMQMAPKDSFCSKCGARAQVTTPSLLNNPYSAPQYCKTCPKCHSYVNAVLMRCPHCNFEFVRPGGPSMSVKKILSLIALALAVLGLFRSILFEVAALVVGIVSLCMGEKKEKDAKALAIIAIILSIIALVLGILLRIFMAYLEDQLTNEIIKYFFGQLS